MFWGAKIPQNTHKTIISEAFHHVCFVKRGALFPVEHLEPGHVPAGYKVCEAFPVKSGKRDMEKIKQDREGFVIPVGEEMKEVKF